MTNWQGKTAVVCGGTSGLGYAIASELICQRAGRVILLARNPEQLESTRLKLVELSKAKSIQAEIDIVSADLTDADSTERASQYLSQHCGAVDLVIQAAGASDRGTIAGLTRQRLIDTIDANVTTSLHAVKYFAPLLRANRGVIVLIGSLSSLFAPRFLSGYSIAKHGVAALAQQSRLELADEGVHVILCCPGPIAGKGGHSRYQSIVDAARDLPAEASRPGGGAKVRQLDPQQLSMDILKAANRRKISLVRPRIVWWLRLVSLVSPRLGDAILRRRSS